MAKKTTKFILLGLMISVIICTLTGCEMFNSGVQSIKGSIEGNEYLAEFYTNNGEKFMVMHGERIDLNANTGHAAVKTCDKYESNSKEEIQ